MMVLTMASMSCRSQDAGVRYYTIPTHFTENAGQWIPGIRYGSELPGRTIVVESDGIAIAGRTHSRSTENRIDWERPLVAPSHDALVLRFLRARPDVSPHGEEQTSDVSHYYFGNDSEGWRDQVRNYASVRYAGVWRDIDVVVSEREGMLRETYELSPGARVSDIAFSYDPSDGKHPIHLVDRRDDHGSIAATMVKRHDGTYGFSLSRDTVYNGRLYFTTEFSTTFGGAVGDGGENVLTDHEGNIYLSGTTLSPDFPLKHVRDSALILGGVRGPDIFLMKLSCEGDLEFSTHVGSSLMDHPCSMHFGKDSSVVIAGVVGGSDYPMTSNALQRKPPVRDSLYRSGPYPVLTRFTCDGKLLYSSYLGGDTAGSETISMAIDRDGYVYLAGNNLDPQITRTRTVGGDIRPNHFFKPALVKLTPFCDSVVYGVCLGDFDMNDDWGTSLMVDSLGNIMLSGLTYDMCTPIPLKNAWQSNIHGVVDPFLMKIYPDATDFVFSTYFGGTGTIIEDAIAGPVTCDASGNITAAGVTGSPDFPLLHPYRSAQQSGEGFLSTFSPSGQLMYSTLFGGNGFDQVTAVKVDPCGNRILVGSSVSADLPLVTPLSERVDSMIAGVPMFISVMDSDGDSILFSTFWGSISPNDDNGSDMEILQIDDYGYIYLTGATVITDNTIPRINRRYYTQGGATDCFLTRLFLPMCNQDYVTCAIATIDTLRYETNRDIMFPGRFSIDVDVINTHTENPAEDVNVELKLPPGLSLDPYDQDLVKTLSPRLLPPGNRGQLTWTVRAVTSLSHDTSCMVRAVVTWRNPRSKQVCPLPFHVCETNIPVVREVAPLPELVCSLEAPDSVRADETATAYAPNPFQITATIENTGKAPAELQGIVLRLPGGMGMSLVTPADSMQGGGVLAPGGRSQTSWQVRATSLARARMAEFIAVAVDTYGIDQALCTHAVVFDSLRPANCALFCADTLRYNPASGTYEPSLLIAAATIRNDLDTMVTGIEAEIDLAGAVRFALDTNETAMRTLPVIGVRSSQQVSWRLHLVMPPDLPDRQVLRVRIRTTSPQGRTDCTREIVVIPPARETQCTLDAPPVDVDTNGRGYVPDSLLLRLHMRNTGQATVDLASAELVLLPASAAQVRELLLRPLSDLPAGEEDSLVWTLDLMTSRFDRSAALTVAVRDSSGAELTECGKRVFIPRIERDLRCAMVLPDTLHYDLASNGYSPDPFIATMNLSNVLDTAQAVIEAEIDLSAAPHLGLDVGENMRKTLDSITAHGNETAAWRVIVAQRSDSAITERVTARYRHAGDTTWLACGHDIVIGGGKRVIAAGCATAGHDTLWADIRYEDVVPHPLQVQYTITNTGNVPLDACRAAVVHPPLFTLLNPADSIRDYGTIAPGASASREWLMEIDAAQAQPASVTLSWVWNCANLAADTACEHHVTLVVGSPPGIVLSPWLLRFRAERYAPLPPVQAVTLWTGGALSMPWQLQPSASWLDVQPLAGSKMQAVSVQPNTTDLQDGAYPSVVDVASSAMVAPPRVDVIYEIGLLNAIAGPPASPRGIDLEAPYPNPTRGAASIAFTIGAASAVQLALYDIYGRRVVILAEGPYAAGRHTVRADLATLPAGVYVCVLHAGGACAARRVVLRK